MLPSMTPPEPVDPEGTRYPGTRDPHWGETYAHRWWRRWDHVRSRRSYVWPRFKQRLKALFNPRWLP
jgi:hypothetical protein